MYIDYHCHTTASDGTLTPQQLVALAITNGIESLSITDHDSVSAYQQLDMSKLPLAIIYGVEFSTQWRNMGVHVVGLNIDPNSMAIKEAIDYQSHARKVRAHQIAEKLERYGLEAPLEGALAQAQSETTIGRPHFAHYMVEAGFVKNHREAFKKYLGSGKPCDIKHTWATLKQVIDWINGAGGIAVLAHPGKYKITRTRLIALITDFVAFEGKAIEVVSGLQIPKLTQDFTQLCEAHKLYASWGSDFHQPDQSWARLGKYSRPPQTVTPVWHYWQ